MKKQRLIQLIMCSAFILSACNNAEEIITVTDTTTSAVVSTTSQTTSPTQNESVEAQTLSATTVTTKTTETSASVKTTTQSKTTTEQTTTSAETTVATTTTSPQPTTITSPPTTTFATTTTTAVQNIPESPAGMTTVYVNGQEYNFASYIFEGKKCFNANEISNTLQGTGKEKLLGHYLDPFGYFLTGNVRYTYKEDASGNERTPFNVNNSTAVKYPFGGTNIGTFWIYQQGDTAYFNLTDLALFLDFDCHEYENVIHIETEKCFHTDEDVEWWKIDPSTVTPTPNWYTPQYSYQIFLTKLNKNSYCYREVWDNYILIDFLKNQPPEAYEGIGEETFGEGLKTPYQQQMKIRAFVNDWLSENQIDYTTMRDSQKIAVIELFLSDLYLPDGTLNHNCRANKLHDIIEPSNSLTLTTAIENHSPCGFYAAIADAFMETMGIRYTFHNLAGDINGVAHIWNGYWDTEAGEYIFFDTGLENYNMRYEDLAENGYVINTT